MPPLAPVRAVIVQVLAITTPVLAVLAIGASPSRAQRLGGGSFVVDATLNPSNQNILVRGTIPDGLEATAGRELIVTLRDASRPDRVCPVDGLGGLDEGCVVVDWPAMLPDPRPYPNRLTLDASQGSRVTLHLRRSGTLAAEPEPPFG